MNVSDVREELACVLVDGPGLEAMHGHAMVNFACCVRET